MPITLTPENGSHRRNQTAAAASATKAMRASSAHSTRGSVCSPPLAALATTRKLWLSAHWGEEVSETSWAMRVLSIELHPSCRNTLSDFLPGDFLTKVRLDHSDDFVRGDDLPRCWLTLAVEHVTLDVTFQQFGH